MKVIVFLSMSMHSQYLRSCHKSEAPESRAWLKFQLDFASSISLANIPQEIFLWDMCQDYKVRISHFDFIFIFQMPKDRYHQHQLHPVSDLNLLSTPEHRSSRKSVTPQPPHLRNSSRASSHGSRRSHEPPVDQFKENSLNVYLHDVQHLVRKNIVGLPGIFPISCLMFYINFLQVVSQNQEIQCWFSMRKLVSPVFPKEIFIYCSNILYQLYQERSRLHILHFLTLHT